MARRKKAYVDNKKFLEEMTLYRQQCEEADQSGDERPPINNYIGKCIYDISNKLATKPNFSGYTFKDEMICDGIENAIRCVGNFDPEKSKNPFAYFTQVIYFAFLRRIAKEKKVLYTKHKVYENVVSNFLSQPENVGLNPTQYADTDYMYDFAKSYEQTMKEKKEKKK
tara:strand:+ start:112 stop:615 length:504 start_codon:yes stop_codon:yes gene_type:complete